MPNGVSPYAAYPFMLHELYSLPWGLQIAGNQLTLRSIHCRGPVRSSSVGTVCLDCEKLRNNDILKGILKRIETGVDAHCALVYQPIAGLIELVRKKNQKIDNMRLMKLTISRKVSTRTGTLDDYKKFVMALSEGKVQRVDALI